MPNGNRANRAIGFGHVEPFPDGQPLRVAERVMRQVVFAPPVLQARRAPLFGRVRRAVADNALVRELREIEELEIALAHENMIAQRRNPMENHNHAMNRMAGIKKAKRESDIKV